MHTKKQVFHVPVFCKTPKVQKEPFNWHEDLFCSFNLMTLARTAAPFIMHRLKMHRISWLMVLQMMFHITRIW